MMKFDEHGLYCDEEHERINFENWADAEAHDIQHIRERIKKGA